MSDQFVAEIRMFGCNFAPRGWAFCNGQLLPISSNTALFSLLGTTYGGNGQTTFGLPNLQGMAAMHYGQGPGLSNRSLGETGGVASVTLLTTQIPNHGHVAIGVNADGNSADPTGKSWAIPSADRDLNFYSSDNPTVAMNANALGIAGGGQAHNNLMPYVAVNYCIALQGVYPSRN